MSDKNIRIYWYPPLPLNDAIENELSKEQGLYYITRIFGTKETSLYIGKASWSNTIANRLRDHRDHWLQAYRGKLFVRVGHVIYPRNLDMDEEASIIDHAESAMLYDRSHRKLFPENVYKRKSYTYSEIYSIVNLGDSYQLSTVIKMQDQE